MHGGLYKEGGVEGPILPLVFYNFFIGLFYAYIFNNIPIITE